MSGADHEGRTPAPQRDDEIAALRSENRRLIALLDAHGVEWRLSQAAYAPDSTSGAFAQHPRMSNAEKVAIFRRLFRGRTDVYPVRWESQKTGAAG